ncbi:aromatic amino acid lyase [Candidatus Saganbacteria bacterium]|nr:aromatic amino acid lyase [Candidatus Saganbacteria bacterium]
MSGRAFVEFGPPYFSKRTLRKLVPVGQRALSLPQLHNVVRYGDPIVIGRAATEPSDSQQAIQTAVASRKAVYGVTTGFGSLRDFAVAPEDAARLQQNIIDSHDVNLGNLLSLDVVRAMQVVRLEALAQGHSGVSPQTLHALAQIINAGITPIIGEWGSVGASGDLAPLAALARVLTGDSRKQVSYREEIMDAATALERAGIAAIILGPKEGLALTNGTSLMAAYLATNLWNIFSLLQNALLINNVVFEALLATDAALIPGIQDLRGQVGQCEIAKVQRALLSAPHGDNPFTNRRKVQDDYSLRCTPQILGGFWNAIKHSADICSREINAVTDNPLFVEGHWVSGGNFHGMPIALALDYLAIGLSTSIGNLFAAQAASLIDVRHNNGLAPCLIYPGANIGLESSHMIVQYLMAAIAADLRRLAAPASVHSLATCGNAEDIVSMGPNAGRKLQEAIQRAFQLETAHLGLAIQALLCRKELIRARLQAVIDELKKNDSARPIELLGQDPVYGYLVDIEIFIAGQSIKLGDYLRSAKKVPHLQASAATEKALAIILAKVGDQLPLRTDAQADFPQLFKKLAPLLLQGDLIKAVETAANSL